MAEIDADELLRRIRAARDWAAAEEDRHFAAAEEAGEDRFAASIVARSFNSIRAVLDEIVEPGKHSRQG
ncbi:hypothetical protein [Streptomyces lavendulae]|uniref:hypothetical protein n=1 Tax=Streptomyces lavendulae TaxID=1914 RepID=UPI0033F4D69B